MKVRRVDLYPDDFLAGIAGKLDAAGLGVYFAILLLIYTRGGPIENDAKVISKILGGTDRRIIENRIAALIASGKLTLNESYLACNRALSELQRSSNRVASWSQNGRKGGRPSKQNNGLEKAKGFGDQKTINHQSSIINHHLKESEEKEFADWYAAYPRKVDPGQAKRAYRTARKIASAGDLMAAVKRYAAECQGKDKKFVKHPATWLNAQSWKNEPEPEASHGQSKKLTPVESLFLGAHLAVEQREAKRQADRGADIDAALSFLDERGRSEA